IDKSDLLSCNCNEATFQNAQGFFEIFWVVGYAIFRAQVRVEAVICYSQTVDRHSVFGAEKQGEQQMLASGRNMCAESDVPEAPWTGKSVEEMRRVCFSFEVFDAGGIRHPFDYSGAVIFVIDNLDNFVAFDERGDMRLRRASNQKVVV